MNRYKDSEASVVSRWDSLPDFAADMEEAVANGKLQYHTNVSWIGEAARDTLKGCRQGDMRLVSEAQRLLEEANMEINLPRREWTRDVAGAFPDVGAFCAGNPECMYTKRWAAAQTTPMRIWLCNTSSAGVRHEMLARRGVAILALLLGLQQYRTVELYVFSMLSDDRQRDGRWAVCRVRTDLLAEAAWALTSQGLSRGFMYEWLHAMDGSGDAWPANLPAFEKSAHDKKAAYEWADRFCRRVLGAEPQDLVIPPSHLYDHRLTDNPLAWLKDQVQAYLGQEELA